MSLKYKTRAIIVGVLILVAYSMLLSGLTDIKWVTTLFDTVSALAVIGIAALMFPLFKAVDRRLFFSYISFKILEGTLMIAAGAFFLTDFFQGLRSWIYNYPQTYVFIVSAFLFYILLLKTKLVPRFISIWGLIACCALLTVNIIKSLNTSFSALDALLILIVTNEAFLAFWLIIKGFNQSSIESINVTK